MGGLNAQGTLQEWQRDKGRLDQVRRTPQIPLSALFLSKRRDKSNGGTEWPLLGRSAQQLAAEHAAFAPQQGTSHNPSFLQLQLTSAALAVHSSQLGSALQPHSACQHQLSSGKTERCPPQPETQPGQGSATLGEQQREHPLLTTTSGSLQHQAQTLFFKCSVARTCSTAQQRFPSAQSHLTRAMAKRNHCYLTASASCYLNWTLPTWATEWRAPGTEQRRSKLGVFWDEPRHSYPAQPAEQCLHNSALCACSASTGREQLPKMDIEIFMTTNLYHQGRCARKTQTLHMKPYGEVAGSLSSTSKKLLSPSPPTHSLMNPHQLGSNFNFVLLIVAEKLNTGGEKCLAI